MSDSASICNERGLIMPCLVEKLDVEVTNNSDPSDKDFQFNLLAKNSPYRCGFCYNLRWYHVDGAFIEWSSIKR